MKTNQNSLPEPVSRYLAAANRFDAAAAAECFAIDAAVRDENHDYSGRDAVRAWIEETSRKYHPTLTLMSSSVRGDDVTLALAVSGQFPGSPVTLNFTMHLHEGKISKLSIE